MSKRGWVDGIGFAPGSGVHPDFLLSKHQGMHALEVADDAEGIEGVPQHRGPGHASVEVFHNPSHYKLFVTEPMDDCGPGWYWWLCQPGCLPDSEPIGPFGSSTAAYEDAVRAHT